MCHILKHHKSIQMMFHRAFFESCVRLSSMKGARDLVA
jgi:hypothetical protein